MLKEKAAQQKLLKEKLQIRQSISPEDQATYYSKWTYIAVHMLLTIPQMGLPALLAKRLKISQKEVQEVIEFLVSRGIIKSHNGQFEVVLPVLHLEADSPLIAHHHRNWRLKSMQAVDKNSAEDLHYSAVATCTKSDQEKIRSILMNAIKTVGDHVQKAKEEEAFVICVDWFGL